MRPIVNPETTYQAVGAIRPEDVAKKLAAIRNHEYPVLLAQLADQPRLVEMMWFLQYTSTQPGGLVKFCADMFAQLPERFGTETMRAAKRPEYTLQEKRSINGEIPYKYNPAGMIDPDNETPSDELLAAILDRAPDSEEERASQRREFERRLKSWTAKEIRCSCQEAVENILPRYLEDLCVKADKGFTELGDYDHDKGPHWFMDDPVAAVFEMMDRRAIEVSKRLAMTAVTKKVFDALDYALQERVMVRIEGDSRFGKTESVRAWADMRPGLARVVEVPSSNSLEDLLRRVAESLGLAFSYGTRGQILRERIEYVLKQSGIFLIFDEAAFLVPQNYTPTTAPARLNWVRREVADRKLPLALIHTPQTFMPAVEKFVKKTAFSMQQFTGRNYRIVELPTEMDREDLIAVARIHFPELGIEYLEVIADLAELSENYLQMVEAVAKLSRFVARREGHHRITVSDIETAASELIPRREVPEPDSTSGDRQQPGTRRTPVRAAERAIKEPLKAASRAVQPGRSDPVEAGIKATFNNRSLRGGCPEMVATDLLSVTS
jgi:AAA domain